MVIKKYRKQLIILCVGLIIWFALCLPDPLFKDPVSTVLNDSENILIAAKIASDGQWRFPVSDSIPLKFKQSILHFEDEYFYKHPGINPFSLLRAFIQNIKAAKVVQGGSTISMQVIRLSRKGKARTIYEKLVECILAIRLELRYTKNEILTLYASHAPFGGNVVGLEAAAWRYYGRSPFYLSWGEMATLAVLPNAPGLIYPGENHKTLLSKRNRLLANLLSKKVIDTFSCELAKMEPLPEKPKPLPQLTPHLLQRSMKDGFSQKRLITTIDRDIQKNCNKIIDKHYQHLSQNEIHNAAAIIIEVQSGNVLAYVGNTSDVELDDGNYVDIINSERSSGSILKPFLYAFMLKEGHLLPNTLIPDIPTHISGFSPKNFDKKYDGAVKAGNALARSLNIPATLMLQDYGVDKFHSKLKKLGLSTLRFSADHYGLSLILGGSEVKLWDLVGAYSSMARILKNYYNNNSQYSPDDYHPVYYWNNNTLVNKSKLRTTDIVGAPAIWSTFQTLLEMNRPIEDINWDYFQSSKKIAWKTGTSYGHRDAWSIGITPEYVVGVWVGNADGEGRPGLTGASVAAPILFDIFKFLPPTSWFDPPYDDLVIAAVCKESGHLSGPYCNNIDSILIPDAGLKTEVCPFHQKIFLDKEEKYRVNSDCYPVSEMQSKSWFILPPIMEWYYKSRNPYYRTLPPIHPECIIEENKYMDLIYPKVSSKIFIPKGFDNTNKRTVFEAAHRIPKTIIHWHLDNEYLGSTNQIHQMEINASVGLHNLTIVAGNGETIGRRFEVVQK